MGKRSNTELDRLAEELQNLNPAYVQKSGEELLGEASRRTQSAYAEKRADAKTQYETAEAGLLRELSALGERWDKQIAESDAAYRSAYGQTQRDAVKHGMQRSSYLAETLSNLLTAGNESRQRLESGRAAEEKQKEEERSLLANQYQSRINLLNENQRTDTQSTLDTLMREEQSLLNASRSNQSDLAMRLYEYRHQLEQENEERERWQAEFNAKYGKSRK